MGAKAHAWGCSGTHRRWWGFAGQDVCKGVCLCAHGIMCIWRSVYERECVHQWAGGGAQHAHRMVLMGCVIMGM